MHPEEPKRGTSFYAILLYSALHRLATSRLRDERRDHTLQATALVNEAFIRLSQYPDVGWRNSEHFLACAATTIRRVLVDHARSKKAAKRGAEQIRLELSEVVPAKDTSEHQIAILDLHGALSELAKLDRRAAQVTEMRLFAGLGRDEIASVLEVSPRTIDDDWAMSKAWIQNKLATDSD